jgi:hypothetical protein
MTRRTHGLRASRVLGNVKTSTGQALKAPQIFAGRPFSCSAPFSATGGSGACEAPNTTSSVDNVPGVSASGAF